MQPTQVRCIIYLSLYINIHCIRIPLHNFPSPVRYGLHLHVGFWASPDEQSASGEHWPLSIVHKSTPVGSQVRTKIQKTHFRSHMHVSEYTYKRRQYLLRLLAVVIPHNRRLDQTVWTNRDMISRNSFVYTGIYPFILLLISHVSDLNWGKSCSITPGELDG